MGKRPRNREALNVRDLIDRAAELSGKDGTEFVLEAALRAAEEVLLDQTVFTVSPQAYREFLACLDRNPNPNARLRKSLQTPAPWK